MGEPARPLNPTPRGPPCRRDQGVGWCGPHVRVASWRATYRRVEDWVAASTTVCSPFTRTRSSAWGSPDFVDIHYPVFHGRLERMVRYGCEEEVVYPEVPT